MTTIKKFNIFCESESISNHISFREKITYFDNVNIDFYMKVNNNKIGYCIGDIILHNNSFDDSLNDPYRNTKYLGRDIKSEDLKSNRIIGYISNFEIDDKFRGKGYGSIFINYIIKFFIKKYPKIEGIYLHVDRKNNTAINLYKKAGFDFIDNKFNNSNSVYMKYNTNRNESIAGIELLEPIGPNYGEQKLPVTLTSNDTKVVFSEKNNKFYTKDEYDDLYLNYLKKGGKPSRNLSIFNKYNLDTILNII